MRDLGGVIRFILLERELTREKVQVEIDRGNLAGRAVVDLPSDTPVDRGRGRHFSSAVKLYLSCRA